MTVYAICARFKRPEECCADRLVYNNEKEDENREERFRVWKEGIVKRKEPEA